MSNRKRKELLKKQQQKKRRLIITAIVSVLIIAAIAVSVALVKNSGNKDDKQQDEVTSPTVIGNIISVETEKITSIEINNGEIAYKLNNSAGFEIEGYESELLDTREVASALLYVARQVPYTGKIGNVEKLSDYGLENTEKSVVLNYIDGTQFKLLMGKEYSDFEYYAMQENSDVIYTIPKETYELLMAHPKEYRNKDVCVIDPGTIEALTVEKNGEKEVTVIKDVDFVPTNEYQTTSFLVSYPYNNVIASLGTLQYIFNELGEIRAESVVEENPTDLAKYGLSDDKATIMTIKDGYKTTVLRMGDKKDDNVYLMCNDSKVVYLVAPGFYDLVESHTAVNYVDSFIAIYNIDDVKNIELAKGIEKRKMEISVDSEGVMNFIVDGKSVEDKTFRKMYQNVIGITLKDIIEEEPAGDIYMTITYNFNDSTSVTYTYHDYDEKHCVVKARNGLNCLVLKKELGDAFSNVTKEK